ncbi:uncharacterized protein LOC132707801 [Cylas formicarius]|uniref:uncharacterized protein LOC132707801 n=1 Tax=Cylas formicarius TaxID=197179 RepID=UPI0029588F0E|nr:uncharacterized protein LOC132707801 [Cylas formicarius]
MFRFLLLAAVAGVCFARPGGLGLGIGLGDHGIALAPSIAAAPVVAAAPIVSHVAAPLTVNAGVSQASRVDIVTPVLGTVATGVGQGGLGLTGHGGLALAGHELRLG